MKGDFSRNTFEATKHFSRVLHQQGRVQLDADWNEQTSILLHYLQTLAIDLIGPHGGPAKPDGTSGDGFSITLTSDKKDFIIGFGHYYVNGILCENPELFDAKGNPIPITYATQPDYPLPNKETRLAIGTYLVYLDVWERLITAVEDDRIREVALGGPDTASRAKVVWQVKAAPLKSGTTCGNMSPNWAEWVETWQPSHRGLLKAEAKVSTTDNTNPCLITPDARYRGAENQLYRVEIHDGSRDANGNSQIATFKWSRENGSVVFPIRMLSKQVVTVEHLGRDGRFTLQPGDWVEIVDDDIANLGQANPLHKVQSVDRVEFTVTLADVPAVAYGQDSTKHPLLRRWEGYDAVSKSSGEAWLTLEDGIRIQFQPAEGKGAKQQYRTGDYWLIPARTATGDIEWPEDTDKKPIAQGPRGDHVYAPLKLITVADGGIITVGDDCRCSFQPLECLTP